MKTDCYNGRDSSVVDGSTYPDLKLGPSPLCKNIVVKKCSRLYLGLVMPSSE